VNRPVVVVDPLESGIELAPLFKARGIPVIAVTIQAVDCAGFGMKIQASDFVEVIPDQPNLVEILRKYNPIAIIPGTEEGVSLAEHLTEILTPQFTNDPKKSINRVHKSHMQHALQAAGVATLKTFNTASEKEAETWIKENGLEGSPLIIKPPMSSGSDKVFHIPVKGNWKSAFNRVLTEPTITTGNLSETVIVQEQAIGTEFAVGTVSANGKHHLAHLIKYNKTTYNNRKTVYDYVEFLPFNKEEHGELLEYTYNVLDALGIRWGAAHTEIMLTKKGPRLIESGARMCGGPVVRFAREATGSSQADKLVEVYIDGAVQKEFVFKKSVVPVFLKSPAKGRLSNIEVLAEISTLPTLFNEYIWFGNGDLVPQTVDLLTSIGIVALAGDRGRILLDYEKIREMESQLVISEV
jgi:biotin carboxylase